MANDHEYSILGGVNRSLIGRYIGTAAASISAVIVFVILTLVDLAKSLHLPASIPPSVLSLVGAAAVFSVLYAIFNRFGWRWKHISLFLKVPDVSGTWQCSGETLNADGSVSNTWDGTVTITQTWDRLKVRLVTGESRSNSLSAALMRDEAGEFVLLYHYRNEPKAGSTHLQAHRGFAEITFSNDLSQAEGEYFNGQGRFTFGRMKLSRS